MDGNQANDAASLGGGRDMFVWDPGDGSDVVRGQKQSDLLAFNASGAGEIVDLAGTALACASRATSATSSWT